MGHRPVTDFFLNTREGGYVGSQLRWLSPKEVYVLLCLPAIGQEHVLTLLPQGEAAGRGGRVWKGPTMSVPGPSFLHASLAASVLSCAEQCHFMLCSLASAAA